MIDEHEKEVLKKALAINGIDFQVDIAKEELAELISELGKCITKLSSLLAGTNHLNRNKITLGDLCGEIADVDITIEYLKMTTDPILIDEIRRSKINRLKASLKHRYITGNVCPHHQGMKFVTTINSPWCRNDCRFDGCEK